MLAIRATAAVLVLTFGPALVAPDVLEARDGGCLPDPQYGCITQSGAYSGKYCGAGDCVTCDKSPGAVCSYCKDLENHYNSSDTKCAS